MPFLYIFLLVAFSSPAFSQTGTTKSLTLISSDKLNKIQNDYIIFDARPQKAWRQSHLPGAVSLNWEGFTRIDENKILYRMLTPDRMASFFGRLGITEKSAVAVYGDADSSWGGEGWLIWLLRYLGHQGSVVLLDGGIQAWKAQKLPLSTEDDTKIPATPKIYHPTPNSGIDISTGELSQSLFALQIVDTRSFFERIRGSIPGSVHIPWTRFYTGETKKPISASALKSLLRDHNIDPSKPVIYYCTGGIRSGYAWMVHRLAGLGTARNYEGGFEAWKKRDKKP